MMKKLSLLTTGCVLLVGLSGMVGADDAGYASDASIPMPEAAAPVDPTSSGDPTLDFFLAMQQCKPGVYQQKNVLSSSVGPDWLQQTIIGQSDAGCKVILTTPDSRVMYCNFTAIDLQTMRDQHFLKGMMSDTIIAPSQESVNADLTWSQLKNASCSYTAFEN